MTSAIILENIFINLTLQYIIKTALTTHHLSDMELKRSENIPFTHRNFYNTVTDQILTVSNSALLLHNFNPLHSYIYFLRHL